jgi:predicted dienelactone hydrolase
MTEKNNIEGNGLEALEQVLERFGADRTRWPAPVRRDFAGLIATDREAKARLREAEALDRLLDLAPQPPVDTRALTDRIMAAALAEAPAVPQPQARVAWAQSDRRTSAVSAQWPAAAALAASLVLGAIFGMTGLFDTTVGPLVADASYDTEYDSGRIALGSSDTADLFEEDFL